MIKEFRDFILIRLVFINFFGGFITGTICRIESKDYYVIDEKSGETKRCSLRGKFKKTFGFKKDKLYQTDFAAVGDFVDFDINEDGTGVIHTIHPRVNYLSRKAPKMKGAGVRGERLEQVIAANLDNLFVVSSIQNPLLNNKVIDRFLITGESSHIEVNIIINKIDLEEFELLEYWTNLYNEIGYNVFNTSVKTGEGIEDLRAIINGKKSLFWGQSGVGKSSLLNYLFPHLDLETGEISSSTDKGTHTTVTSVMHKISENTFIIDTPGVREIEPFGVKKEDVGHYFPEFTHYLNDCRFNTCTHQHEPGCAVIEAVDEGKISLDRYDSYLRILETIEDDINF